MWIAPLRGGKMSLKRRKIAYVYGAYSLESFQQQQQQTNQWGWNPLQLILLNHFFMES